LGRWQGWLGLRYLRFRLLWLGALGLGALGLGALGLGLRRLLLQHLGKKGGIDLDIDLGSARLVRSRFRHFGLGLLAGRPHGLERSGGSGPLWVRRRLDEHRANIGRVGVEFQRTFGNRFLRRVRLSRAGLLRLQQSLFQWREILSLRRLR
jgi:hypothetical protein